jgi:hypothetical protein
MWEILPSRQINFSLRNCGFALNSLPRCAFLCPSRQRKTSGNSGSRENHRIPALQNADAIQADYSIKILILNDLLITPGNPSPWNSAG